MADFALLGEAVYRLHEHPPKTFLNEYHEKRTEGIYRTIEASPIAVAAMAYLEDHPQGYDGTVKGLLDALTLFQPTGESWPRSPRGFGDILRRLAPAFRTIGINAKISDKAGKHGYGCVLKYLPKNAKKTPSKGEHGELGECGSARPVPEHIYNHAKNGEKSTILDDVESF